MPVGSGPIAFGPELIFVYVASTWQEWVLNTQHRGPVAIAHSLHNVFFSHVSSTVLYPDTCLQVVKVSSIQLEELNEQSPKVYIGIPSINSWVQLWA